MANTYVFYALTLIVSVIMQTALIYLQTRANTRAPHRSFTFILIGSYVVFVSLFVQYIPVFMPSLGPYGFFISAAAWIGYAIGGTSGIVGAKLLFDRYVELANNDRVHT